MVEMSNKDNLIKSLNSKLDKYMNEYNNALKDYGNAVKNYSNQIGNIFKSFGY